MSKSKLELFLEEEIDYILENEIDENVSKEIKEKIKESILLGNLYRIVDNMIIEKYENFKEEELKNENQG